MLAILTAMPVELEPVLARMRVDRTETLPGCTAHIGTIGRAEVVAASFGVGKACAAQVTQLLICRFSPEAVLHCGIAGAVGEGLHVLDAVAADCLTDRDMSENAKGYVPQNGYFYADEHLIETILRVEPSAKRGCIATGDTFVCSSGEKQRLRTQYGALCAEMESVAVAQTCTVNHVPFAVVRCLSDDADEQAHDTYEHHEKLAAEKAAGILCSAAEALAAEHTDK